MTTGYTPPDPKKLAVYHILQLAEQGRFEEVVAQMVASAVVASGDSGDEAYGLRTKITRRILDLIIDPSEIWEGLLPGGPGVDEQGFVTMYSEYSDRLTQRERNVEEIVSIVGKAEEPWVTMGKLDDYFREEGLVTSPTPAAQDRWEYFVSIVVHPEIRHDDSDDLLVFGQKMTAESPLGLASNVIPLMEKRTRNFPEEEQAAWISQGDHHWMMTWDQAQMIVSLDLLKERMEASNYSADIDFDGEFQGIADMMDIAGREYAAKK